MDYQQNKNQQEEKTFTQEEVNKIVQDRLARIKTEPNEKEHELEQREKELAIKERRIDAQKKLHEKGLPEELIDLIKLDEEASMNASLELLDKTFKNSMQNAVNNLQIVGASPVTGIDSITERNSSNMLREAMGLKE